MTKFQSEPDNYAQSSPLTTPSPNVIAAPDPLLHATTAIEAGATKHRGSQSGERGYELHQKECRAVELCCPTLQSSTATRRRAPSCYCRFTVSKNIGTPENKKPLGRSEGLSANPPMSTEIT
jgi:hypothetical protein